MSIGTIKPQLRIPPGMSSSGKRPKPGLNLGGIVGTAAGGGGMGGAGLGAGRPSNWVPANQRPQASATPFSNFRAIVCVLALFYSVISDQHLVSDPSGALNFGGKAVLHASGVNFSTGKSFAINMSEFRLDEELGRGNYGAVKKVLHKPTNVMMAMKVFILCPSGIGHD